MDSRLREELKKEDEAFRAEIRQAIEQDTLTDQLLHDMQRDHKARCKAIVDHYRSEYLAH